MKFIDLPITGSCSYQPDEPSFRRSPRTAADGGRRPSRGGWPSRQETPAGNPPRSSVRGIPPAAAILSASPRLLPVDQGDPRPVAGGVPDRRTAVKIAVGKHAEAHRRGLVDVAPEGAGQDHPVQLRDPQAFHHQFSPGVEGRFGELYAPDILLVDRDLLVQGGLFAPGDDELRLAVLQAEARRVEVHAGNGRSCR